MTYAGPPCGRMVRFGLVGIAGAVLQLLVFHLLSDGLQLRGAAAAPLAVEFVLLHNFFWHERFTWGDRSVGGLRQRAARLGQFHVANGVVSIAGNTALAYSLIERLGVPAVPAELAIIAVCAPLNFLVSERWIFR